MNETYGLIVNDLLVEIREVGEPYTDRPPLVVNGMTTVTPNTSQQFLDAGWKLYIAPVVTATQKVTQELVIQPTAYSYKVVDKTAQELADEAQAQADADELETEITNNPLSGITFAEAVTYINETATDLAGVQTVLRKLAKAVLINNKRLGD